MATNEPETIIKLLFAMANGTRHREDGTNVALTAAADLINAQQKALKVALKMLEPKEPGDSRAVSDQFVAIYAVQCGNLDAPVIAVLDEVLKNGR